MRFLASHDDTLGAKQPVHHVIARFVERHECRRDLTNDIERHRRAARGRELGQPPTGGVLRFEEKRPVLWVRAAERAVAIAG